MNPVHVVELYDLSDVAAPTAIASSSPAAMSNCLGLPTADVAGTAASSNDTGTVARVAASATDAGTAAGVAATSNDAGIAASVAASGNDTGVAGAVSSAIGTVVSR